MPRVSVKRKEYKMLDLKGWIQHQMKVTGKRQADVAEALGVSQSRVSQMLKIPDRKKSKNEKVTVDPFSYGDLLSLCELFGVDGEEKKRLLTM